MEATMNTKNMTMDNLLDEIKNISARGKSIPLSDSVIVDEKEVKSLFLALGLKLFLLQAGIENTREQFHEGMKALNALAEMGSTIDMGKKVAMTDHVIINPKKLLHLVERFRMEVTLITECA